MDNDTIELTCQQAEDELSGYLDDVLDPRLRGAVEKHLASCERCQAILADFRSSDAMLRALPFIEPPPDLRDRFFTSPRYLKLASARARQRNYITPLAAALVAAAMLVLALGGALLFRQGFVASQQTKGSDHITTIGNAGGGAPLAAGPRLIYERGAALWSAPESGAGLPQQLTPTGIQVAGWRISPNGRAVMYIDARTGALHAIRADALNDTIVGAVTGGKAPTPGFWTTPAGAAIAQGIAWSPDNTRIAYLAQSGGNTALHVMNATGVADSVAKSTGSGIIAHLLWSPDSIYIAYTTTQADTTQSIGVYDVTTSKARSVAAQSDTRDTAATVDQLAWLPTHTAATLTWSTRDGGVVAGVFRADVTSDDSIIRLTPEGTTYIAADVSASGAWVLARGAMVWEVAADQTSPQSMATLVNPVTQVHWAPLGTTAAVVSGDALMTLAAGQAPIVVAHGLTSRSSVAWSPNGAMLAWQAGSAVMSAQVRQGEISGQKTVAERDSALALIWSPDGQSLAAPSSAGLLLVTADGAQVRATDNHATSTGQFSWSIAG